MKRVRYRCIACRALVPMNKYDSVTYKHAPNSIGGDGTFAYGPTSCARCTGMTIAEVKQSKEETSKWDYEYAQSGVDDQ